MPVFKIVTPIMLNGQPVPVTHYVNADAIERVYVEPWSKILAYDYGKTAPHRGDVVFIHVRESCVVVQAADEGVSDFLKWLNNQSNQNGYAHE